MTFREVYDAHFRYVWRTLRALGVAERDAGDVTQDVFVVVHRRLAEFEGRAKMTTWLYAICTRAASDWRRRAYVRHEVTDATAVEGRVDERPDAGAGVERTQGVALLERALDALPEEQRTAFVLYELEELGCEEIAAVLSIPLGTVYSRLRLAREAFRRAAARLQASQNGVGLRAGGER